MRSTRTSGVARALFVGICATALTSTGCSKSEEKSDAEVEETGVDIEKNPLGALKQLAEAGQEMAKKQEEMQKHEPVEPVKFDALVPLLPSPQGWETKNDPRAETTAANGFHISTASQNYEKGEGAERQRMKVTIVDGSYVPMVYAPFMMMSKFSREGTDGHSKGLKIDGHSAFEEWKKKRKSVVLTILVNDRFLITIDGKGVEKESAREWAKYIDLKLLAKWAKDEVTGDQVSPPTPNEDSKDDKDQTGKETEQTAKKKGTDAKADQKNEGSAAEATPQPAEGSAPTKE